MAGDADAVIKVAGVDGLGAAIDVVDGAGDGAAEAEGKEQGEGFDDGEEDGDEVDDGANNAADGDGVGKEFGVKEGGAGLHDDHVVGRFA